MLLTMHNLAYYNRLMAEARKAISEKRYAEFCTTSLARWGATF